MRNMAQSTCAVGSFRQKYQCPEGAFFTFESSPATQRVSNWFSSSAFTCRFSSETETTGGEKGRPRLAGKSVSPKWTRRKAGSASVGQREKLRRISGRPISRRGADERAIHRPLFAMEDGG